MPGQPVGIYGAFRIVDGPDGAIWFTNGNGWIGRITGGGSLSGFVLPTPTGLPQIIALGPDGSLWFTELKGNKIGRLAPASSGSQRRRRAVRR